jgi:hypothetical protein
MGRERVLSLLSLLELDLELRFLPEGAEPSRSVSVRSVARRWIRVGSALPSRQASSISRHSPDRARIRVLRSQPSRAT